MNECIKRGGTPLPDVIVDGGTLRLDYLNNGFVNLTVSILRKNTDPLYPGLVLDINGKQFQGFIGNQSAKKNVGTEYYEYNVQALGVICDSTSGGLIGG
jgi:hypothetical protein